MSRRRPSFAERRLRSDLWRFLSRNVQVLAGFAVIVCAAVIPISFVVSGYLRGLVHGIVVASAVFAIWQLFLIHGGHMYRLSGVWGEDNTRDVLEAPSDAASSTDGSTTWRLKAATSTTS